MNACRVNSFKAIIFPVERSSLQYTDLELNSLGIRRYI